MLHLLEHFPGACVRLEHVIGWIRHCYPHFPVVKPWKSYYETGFYNFCNFSKICNQNMSQGGTKNRFFRKTPRESTGKWLISSQLNFYQNRTKTHEIRANDLVGRESILSPPLCHLSSSHHYCSNWPRIITRYQTVVFQCVSEIFLASDMFGYLPGPYSEPWLRSWYTFGSPLDTVLPS